jgi:hypothetical protein
MNLSTKTILFLLLSIFLFLSLFFIDSAWAPVPPLTVTFENPAEGSTFSANNVTLSFFVVNSVASNGFSIISLNVYCYLDGQFYGQPKLNENNSGKSNFYGELALTNLTLGQHTIEIKGNGTSDIPSFIDTNLLEITPASTIFYVNSEPAQ